MLLPLEPVTAGLVAVIMLLDDSWNDPARWNDLLIAVWFTADALANQGSRRPGLLVDRAGGIAGIELVNLVQSVARTRQLDLYARVVPEARNASTVVADMLAAGIDGFIYTGTPERAATVARALDGEGFSGPRFLDAPSATAPSATASFTAAAGGAAEGWRTVTSYSDPDSAPLGFATAFRERYGSAPGTWAAETYDTTRPVIDRLTDLAGPNGRRPSRAQLTKAVSKARFKGLTMTYEFDEAGQLKPLKVHQYRVEDGKFAYVGAVGQA
ncbi:hypothetical protein [Streptomyces sp. NBC_00286]|uniref:hypothetical protein n=1 Tax=Streptomyces sp. NBC_00286 TaxID=2975701 RepID=UPI002E2E72A8|nr:hypothetical protein [Streptomyces sp. NBC_00286]